MQDKVVAAVLSGASNVKRLVTAFTEGIGDPQEAPLEGGQTLRKSIQGVSCHLRT